MPDEVSKVLGIINENRKIIQKSKDTEVIISLSIIALFYLRNLLEYEETDYIIPADPVNKLIIKIVETTNGKLIRLLTDEYRTLRINSKNLHSGDYNMALKSFISKADSLRSYILHISAVDRMINDLSTLNLSDRNLKPDLIIDKILFKISTNTFFTNREAELNAVQRTL
jgi:hypothetical protein